ncbi:MAG: MarR family winged helix-turn-helix transcriptional regulator [Solirubrobacteraceae bacterium]
MTTVDPHPPGGELEAIDARDQLGHSFKALMGAVRRLRGREAQRLGKLSYAQYSLLFGLAAERELSASQLAGIADLSPATVTQMLDHLESDRLVKRVRSERDKRVVLVSLTMAGRTLVEERRARFEPRWQAALTEFSDEELLTAAAVLERLRELFDEIDGG